MTGLTVVADTKQCSKCRETKPVDEFHKQRAAKDGLHSWCKSCNSAAARDWKAANPERNRANKHKWEVSNPGRLGDRESMKL